MTDAGDYRAPRVRDDIPALPGGYSIPNGRIYLPIPATNAPQAVAAGAVEGPRGGVYVELPPSHWKPEIEPLLPLLARKDVLPILPDLIPVSTWGSNLAQLLTKPSWDALRLPVIAARGNLCQICGEKQGAMECHEIWAYSLPPQDAPKGTVGVQRLVGLAALCHSCHMMFHHGLARIQGNFESVMERLVAVNRWTRADFQSYYADMARRYKQRCEVNWAFDVSLVAGLAPLVIQDGRDGWSMNEEGALTSATRQSGMPGWTVILGARYVVNGCEISAMDPGEARDGLLPEDGDFDFVRQMSNGLTRIPPP